MITSKIRPRIFLRNFPQDSFRIPAEIHWGISPKNSEQNPPTSPSGFSQEFVQDRNIFKNLSKRFIQEFFEYFPMDLWNIFRSIQPRISSEIYQKFCWHFSKNSFRNFSKDFLEILPTISSRIAPKIPSVIYLSMQITIQRSIPECFHGFILGILRSILQVIFR